MDKISECATNFSILKKHKYRFIVSQNRRTSEIFLDFCDKDFYHLAGLHYLKDISLPSNRRETLHNIIHKKNITEQLLAKSRFYSTPNSNIDIKSRIEELCLLEQYLDSNNIIKIYNTQNDPYLHSSIEADYLIESQLKGSKTSVYIFLKKRLENPNFYCVTSFFKKTSINYGGQKSYWMLKENISPSGSAILYKHTNFIDSSH